LLKLSSVAASLTIRWPFVVIGSNPVWQLAAVKGKHGVCVSDRAVHRCVQLISDKLIGQNQTGIHMGSGANRASGLYKEDTGERRFLSLAAFGLCLDDVGIGARAVPNAINGSTQRGGYSVRDKMNSSPAFRASCVSKLKHCAEASSRRG
jgi:hypothetical protein